MKRLHTSALLAAAFAVGTSSLAFAQNTPAGPGVGGTNPTTVGTGDSQTKTGTGDRPSTDSTGTSSQSGSTKSSAKPKKSVHHSKKKAPANTPAS